MNSLCPSYGDLFHDRLFPNAAAGTGRISISGRLWNFPYFFFYYYAFGKACTRACLKNAFCEMCFTVCGEFIPNLGVIVGYVD